MDVEQRDERNEQDIFAHLLLTDHTVVHWFIDPVAVEPDGDIVLQGVLAHQHRLPDGPHQGGLHGVVELGVGHPDVPRHVPREVDHRHDGLVPLALVPLVPGGGGGDKERGRELKGLKMEKRNDCGNCELCRWRWSMRMAL